MHEGARTRAGLPVQGNRMGSTGASGNSAAIRPTGIRFDSIRAHCANDVLCMSGDGECVMGDPKRYIIAWHSNTGMHSHARTHDDDTTQAHTRARTQTHRHRHGQTRRNTQAHYRQADRPAHARTHARTHAHRHSTRAHLGQHSDRMARMHDFGDAHLPRRRLDRNRRMRHRR